jgi:hypothetical protein
VVSGDGFERWLEQQLQSQAAGQSGPSPMPAQAQYHATYVQAGLHMSVLANAVALVSAKGAIGLTIAALAIGTAGAEAAITGSANPGNWGQQVVQQVQKCKDPLALLGSHGIGECVSTFANKHGKQVSSEHRASGAPQNPPTSHPTGPPTSHPTGPPTSHPTGPPTAHPGQPSSHPGGRPSSTPRKP